jgi:hypothetical protein
VIGLVLGLAGCSNASAPDAVVETVVETVYVTPDASPAQENPEPDESNDATVEASDDELSASTATECLVITSNPKKKWQDKGKSYQQLWLYTNFTIKNDCEKRVKSVKFNWTAQDEFGEEWPGGYEFVDAIRTDPGQSWKQNSNYGYRHYDSDRNFAVVKRLTEDEIVPRVSDIRIVFSDGSTAGGID